MCGIFGFSNQFDCPDKILGIMGNEQIHRGPDDKGTYIGEAFSLGMRRLSIIDLKHGRQPFFSSDKSVVVICNGEIYNYIELRKKLKGKGYLFSTESDIEVIPHLYQEYGMDFIHQLNGMYCIALYDLHEDVIYIIRDRIGIKPLYYSDHGGNFIFSSELKSIHALNVIPRDLDFDALSTYLELLYIPSPRTPFKHIRKLKGGTWLKYQGGKLYEHNYWDPVTRSAHTDDDGEKIANTVRELLHDSINLEMRSDVPVGSFLSGGLDSSAITALSSEKNSDLATFHMQWNGVDGKIDESVFAEHVVKHLAIGKHYSKRVTDDDIIFPLPELIWHLDEPMADGAFLPTYALARLAAENAKVILSGAGGDELFGGYGHYMSHSIIKSLLGKLLFNKAPAFSYYDIWKPKHASKYHSLFPWFRPGSGKHELDCAYKGIDSHDRLNRLMLCDLKWYLPDDILMLTDKMTMAASIECRVPLLDHRLVEYCLSIPSSAKIKGGHKKCILKKIMSGHLPYEILHRKKEGFGAPIPQWVTAYKGPMFDSILEESRLVDDGLMNRAVVKEYANKQNLAHNESWDYWKILILEMWYRIFIRGEDKSSIIS